LVILKNEHISVNNGQPGIILEILYFCTRWVGLSQKPLHTAVALTRLPSSMMTVNVSTGGGQKSDFIKVSAV
jgi:hypothetical protein